MMNMISKIKISDNSCSSLRAWSATWQNRTTKKAWKQPVCLQVSTPFLLASCSTPPHAALY